MVEPKVLLVKRLSDKRGVLCVEFDARLTETQASVNGGSATRNNAYIYMKGASEYRGEKAKGGPQSQEANQH